MVKNRFKKNTSVHRVFLQLKQQRQELKSAERKQCELNQINKCLGDVAWKEKNLCLHFYKVKLFWKEKNDI